ncbi:MAG: phosphatase PAP2 family protein [Deltaproteobacteria bacterium]|nr:phosphatase PAP2 family protein [Deltaproteobacteria bacterium]
MSGASTLAAIILIGLGRHVTGWNGAATTFLVVAAMPWVGRLIHRRWPTEPTRFLATIVPPAVGIIVMYSKLDPLVDLLNPHLADPRLAALDQRIFGFAPGFWLERHLPPAALSVLFLFYTSYYIWPVAIGLVLFARHEAGARDCDRFILGYVLVMLGSYLGYVLVPAIGPRFFLIDQVDGPVAATPMGLWLNEMFRGAPFFRDCFPSGHTALTLYCLYESRRLVPRLFWAMLVPGTGLIVATLACRFHYAIDVVCGPVLTVTAIVLADALHARLPKLEIGRVRWAHARAER